MAVRAAAQLDVQRSSRMIAELTNQRSRRLRRHIVCYHMLVKLVKELSSFRYGGVLVEVVDCRLEGFERASPYRACPARRTRDHKALRPRTCRRSWGSVATIWSMTTSAPPVATGKSTVLVILEVQAAFNAAY